MYLHFKSRLAEKTANLSFFKNLCKQKPRGRITKLEKQVETKNKIVNAVAAFKGNLRKSMRKKNSFSLRFGSKRKSKRISRLENRT